MFAVSLHARISTNFTHTSMCINYNMYVSNNYEQGTVLVAVIHGALGPQLERGIKEQLEHEHKVIDGNAERQPVRLTCIVMQHF